MAENQRHQGADVNDKILLSGLALLAATTSSCAAVPEEAPAYLSQHETHVDDTQAIQTLLATYTTSVTNGDEAAFETLLLNDQVPFSSTDELVGPRAAAGPVDTRRYAGFRQAIFGSGTQYTQQFYNVHIEQDGALAQVSLDFVTKDARSGQGGYGWKVLQLLKVQGQWKIASEFYTGRSLPNPS
jgi:hypothetical protein